MKLRFALISPCACVIESYGYEIPKLSFDVVEEVKNTKLERKLRGPEESLPRPSPTFQTHLTRDATNNINNLISDYSTCRVQIHFNGISNP